MEAILAYVRASRQDGTHMFPLADFVWLMALLQLYAGTEFDGQDWSSMAHTGLGEWVCDSSVVCFLLAPPF